MPLFKQDLVKTNKRYVTKIVAQDVEAENYEGTTIGLTSSAFADYDLSGIQEKDIKLYSVWSTGVGGGLIDSGWCVRWGADQTPFKMDASDIGIFVGNDVDEFFLERFSHSNRAETNYGQISVTLNNAETRPVSGTIILEFTI
jgi:hypothetical protein